MSTCAIGAAGYLTHVGRLHPDHEQDVARERRERDERPIRTREERPAPAPKAAPKVLYRTKKVLTA